MDTHTYSALGTFGVLLLLLLLLLLFLLNQKMLQYGVVLCSHSLYLQIHCEVIKMHLAIVGIFGISSVGQCSLA